MFKRFLRVARPFILAAFFVVILPVLAHLAIVHEAVGKDGANMPSRIYGATGQRSDMQLSVIICLTEDHTCYPYSLFEAQDRAKELKEDYGATGVIVCPEGTPPYEAAIDYLGASDEEKGAAWTTLQLVAAK